MRKTLAFTLALALLPLMGIALVHAIPASAAPQDQTIEIRNYMFMTLTVPVGTKVTWINRDDVPHNVVAVDKSFRSAALDTDDTFSHVFATPGTYAYFCTIHPQMVAKIIVTGSPAAAVASRPK